MAFDVAAEAYGRFMGRYAEPLADRFAALLAPEPGSRALDVGCGPGALTARLRERLGSDLVSAVDPSPPFVDAARRRLPGVDVRRAAAEALPYDDGVFDLAAAQLVVHFMRDPVGGLREMARVTAPGGLVAACVWDLHGGRAPLSLFWRAARDVAADVVDESGLPGARAGHLAELFAAAGLGDVRTEELTVRVRYDDLDDWWEPYTLGVGPAGDHVRSLSAGDRDALRARCRELLPEPPFEIGATAWAALGRA